jgi:Flp pilus assembly protein TadD
VVVLVVGALGARTLARNQEYQSDVSIWRTVVDQWPINPRAHNGLGFALARAGHTPEAIAQYEAALRLKPDYAEAHYNLGIYAESHNNLGSALGSAGHMSEAIAHFKEALRLKPDFAEAHSNLGSALASTGHTSEAISQFEEALRLRPDLAGGSLPEVIAQLKAALFFQEQQRGSGPSGEASGGP